MKEHPIPQDITNYRFHIVGSMTLKQFGEVLVGVLISVAIYQTNLIFIIKWPLIVLFFGGGLLAAFVPIEERPLSHWIATFFSILYKPTQFFWKREHNIPAPFLYKGDEKNLITVQEVDLTPQRRQRIKEFLSSQTTITPDPEDLTVYEQQQISTVMTLFESGPQAPSMIRPTKVEKPELKVRVREMREIEEPSTNLSQQPTEEPLPTEIQRIDLSQVQTADAVPQLPDPRTLSSDVDTTQKNIFLDTQQVAQGIEIPEQENIKITEENQEEKEELERTPQSHPQPNEQQVFLSQEEKKQENQSKTQTITDAQFNTDLPFPSQPTEPNKLVGMVLTPQQDVVPNAIVEISTENGHVARAVKTNALGQFFITTPLKNGSYVVTVQKDGESFDPIKINLKGKIVAPLEVRSKGSSPAQ